MSEDLGELSSDTDDYFTVKVKTGFYVSCPDLIEGLWDDSWQEDRVRTSISSFRHECKEMVEHETVNISKSPIEWLVDEIDDNETSVDQQEELLVSISRNSNECVDSQKELNGSKVEELGDIKEDFNDQMNSTRAITNWESFDNGLELHEDGEISDVGGSDDEVKAIFGLQKEEIEGKDTNEEVPQSILVPLRADSFHSNKSLYLTDHETVQVESVYRGLKTEVYVSGCSARLYSASASNEDEWSLQYTGVPVAVLEKCGLTSTVWIILAEKGTGLPLWKDILNFQSQYTKVDSSFHTLCPSSNLCMVVGLNFGVESAAWTFWLKISNLIKQIEENGATAQKKKKKVKGKKAKLPSKSNISNPCCFRHITNVRPTDRSDYLSLQSLVSPLQFSSQYRY